MKENPFIHLLKRRKPYFNKYQLSEVTSSRQENKIALLTVVPACWRLRQEALEFEASLGCRARPCLRKPKPNQKKKLQCN
jgi:hypothetical protein